MDIERSAKCVGKGDGKTISFSCSDGTRTIVSCNDLLSNLRQANQDFKDNVVGFLGAVIVMVAGLGSMTSGIGVITFVAGAATFVTTGRSLSSAIDRRNEYQSMADAAGCGTR
ncbi:hypothetical protein [Deinococcus sp. S9]|uniref:hypothetical protein n=1 Tax=Deinococcus sp. S9 TaxID=2545754 RepID=UPI001056953F|nr:hypothetical protein [Deinococcus sp. S9]TDE84621.1 hypothetical protein E0686_16230 [Deinococcus sp. S9]